MPLRYETLKQSSSDVHHRNQHHHLHYRLELSVLRGGATGTPHFHTGSTRSRAHFAHVTRRFRRRDGVAREQCPQQRRRKWQRRRRQRGGRAGVPVAARPRPRAGRGRHYGRRRSHQVDARGRQDDRALRAAGRGHLRAGPQRYGRRWPCRRADLLQDEDAPPRDRHLAKQEVHAHGAHRGAATAGGTIDALRRRPQDERPASCYEQEGV